MRLRYWSAGVVVGTVAVSSLAHGAVIAAYDFSSGLAASTVATNATPAPVSGGTSTAINTVNDYYASKPFIAVSRTNNTTAQAFFQATITAAPGYELNLDSFTFDGGSGSGSDTTRTYDIHSSVAGLQNTDPSLGSGNFTHLRPASGSSQTLPTLTTDLSGTAYDHLSTLTMRVYFNTATVSQNIDLDNFVFNGTVSPVPEPAALGLIGLAGVIIIKRRRR